ncbi:MAG: polysulfide reductase NrfD [Fimbriimonadia bacterium]|jgi:molybdopterin-containing oxidoreductase family membrane subunit
MVQALAGSYDPSKAMKRLFWAAGIVLFLVGLIGFFDRFVYGHLHAHYGSIVTWGLWVAAYIYFIGLSAGSFLISSLVYVFGVKQFEQTGRLALFTALVTLVLALLSIVLDLGHMGRAWHVMAYPNFKSPMAWMIWLYGAYMLLLAAEIWFVVRRDMVRLSGGKGLRAKFYHLLTFFCKATTPESETRDRRVVRVLATIGVPLAIMFHGGVGALFGVVAARPHWHSGLFPILFVLSALVSGGALLTMVAAVFQDGWRRNSQTVVALGQLVLGLLLLDVIFQVSEFLVAFRGGIPGHVAGLQLVISGPYWWVFWAWQVGVGTLAPILLLVLPTKRNPAWVSLAALLIAAGLFGMRLNIVIPGLAVEEIKGLSQAVASLRTTPHYFPSLQEFLVTIGIGGLGLLLFGLGELLLPRSSDDLEGKYVRL